MGDEEGKKEKGVGGGEAVGREGEDRGGGNGDQGGGGEGRRWKGQ